MRRRKGIARDLERNRTLAQEQSFERRAAEVCSEPRVLDAATVTKVGYRRVAEEVYTDL